MQTEPAAKKSNEFAILVQEYIFYSSLFWVLMMTKSCGIDNGDPTLWVLLYIINILIYSIALVYILILASIKSTDKSNNGYISLKKKIARNTIVLAILFPFFVFGILTQLNV